MTASQDFDELLVACLARIEAEGEDGLAAHCAEHPELAAQLRARVRLLRGAGLLPAPEGEALDFPERLGDFRLLHRLGQGGMGVVYLAEQESIARRVALKLIRPEQLHFPGARQRFAREVEAVGRLAHPGIVPVHMVGEEGGIPFFAMEYVQGASLEAVVQAAHGKNPAILTGHDMFRAVLAVAGYEPDGEFAERPPFDDSWSSACLWIAREVAQALEHAHQRGVLHRDVKPSNVMLTPEGRVLLLDFGLASAEGAAVLTGSGARVGSLAYMAPEQVEGRADQVAQETDVYGLGVTLYELLALRGPFDAPSPTDVRRAILSGHAPGLRELAPTASPDMEAVVAKAMALERQQRYPRAADFARDLTRLMEQRPVEARSAGPWRQLVRWTQHNRTAAVALGLALLVAVGGPLAFGYQQYLLTSRIQAEKLRADELRDAADRERDTANEQRALAVAGSIEADEQRAIAERARAEAETQRARGEESLAKALEAVEVMLEGVSEERLAEVPQMERVRRELLTAAREFLVQLGAGAGDVPELRYNTASVGVALAHLERLLGNEQAAASELRTQIAVLRELVAETGSARERSALALALARMGWLHLDEGEHEAVLELTDEGLSLLEEGLVLEVDGDTSWIETLSVRRQALLELGRGPEALRAADRGIEVARRHLERNPQSREARRIMAVTLSERGRIVLGSDAEEAAEFIARGRDMLRDLMLEDSSERHLRLSFCELCTSLSTALALLDRHDEAFEVTAEAVEVAEGLVELDPDRADLRHRLGGALVNRGQLAAEAGAWEAAASDFEEALPLVALDPGGQRELASRWMAAARLIESDEELDPLERGALAAEFHGGALRALTSAAGRGTLDPEDLEGGELWDPLRERAEFKAALAAARR